MTHPPLDPIPGRHPRLPVWARAFRRAGYTRPAIATLFDLDLAELTDMGVKS